MSSQAYTPGLKVKSIDTIRKTRRLPVEGEVLVRKGDKVQADTIVAKTRIPGSIHVLNMADELKLIPQERYSGVDETTGLGQYRVTFGLEKYMNKKEGDMVQKDEIIGMSSSFFGLSKKFAKSLVDGTIERVSDFSGQVFIREPPTSLEVDAYVSGEVVEILPQEGAVIETEAAFIQGIFGIGGETRGKLAMAVDSFDKVLEEVQVGADCTGKILVGGSLVTLGALRKMAQLGAKGVIVGGIRSNDIIDFLGRDVGVAITGHEQVGLTLMITEGFGRMNMSKRIFSLLKQLEGKQASMNGATQIRAGVVRPELIVPRDDLKFAEGRLEKEISVGLLPGTRVRIIREPYFGALGTVIALPPELLRVITESEVRVLEAELEDGKKVIVPRANVEIIEE